MMRAISGLATSLMLITFPTRKAPHIRRLDQPGDTRPWTMRLRVALERAWVRHRYGLVPIRGGAGHQSPSDVMAITPEIDPVDQAASTAANGAGVDMAGWEGVMFVLSLGATDRTLDGLVQGDDNAGFSSPTAITGAAITQLTATDDNKIAIIDVWRPTERYARLVATPGAGGTTTVISAVAIRYRGSGTFPITQDAAVAEVVKVAVN